MKDFIGQLDGFFKQVTDYLHPIGKFYVKFQLIFRVLVTAILLSDVWSSLKCDTKQLACEEMCENRFRPITFKKLWELELFFMVITTGMFIVVKWSNHKLHKKFLKRRDAKDQNNSQETDNFTQKPGLVALKSQRLKMHTVTVKNKVVEQSNLIDLGYLLMLIIRLSGEIWFTYLERQLGTHQTGKECSVVNFNLDCLLIPEKVSCKTNIRETEEKAISEIFYNPDPLEACDKQEYEVPCYIPKSWMRQKAVVFMHFVLVIGIFLTLAELVGVIHRRVQRILKKRRAIQRENVGLLNSSSYVEPEETYHHRV